MTPVQRMQTGEVSRYFYQLKYLYPDHFEISERVVAYDVAAPEISPVTVEKTAMCCRNWMRTEKEVNCLFRFIDQQLY